MKSTLIAPLLGLALPLLTNAFPHSAQVLEARDESPNESQTEYDQETTSLTSQGLCRAYYSLAVPDSKSVGMCYNKCGDLVKQRSAAGNSTSVSCVTGGINIPIYNDPDGNQYSVGKCICDIPFVDEIVNDVLMALPIIAEIGCEILFDSLDLVLEIGAAAIPGVGAEMDAGMAAAVKAAKTIVENGQDASSFLQWFANPCGSSNYTQMIDNIFNPLSSVPDSVMPGTGCKSKKCPGKGKGGDSPEPSAKPSAKPSDSPEPSASASKPSESDSEPSQSASKTDSSSPSSSTKASSSASGTSASASSTITSSASRSSASSSASSSGSSDSSSASSSSSKKSKKSSSSSSTPTPSPQTPDATTSVTAKNTGSAYNPTYTSSASSSAPSSTAASSTTTSSSSSSSSAAPTATASPNCQSTSGSTIPASDATAMISDWQSKTGQQLCLPKGLQSTVAGLQNESQVMMNGSDGACADYGDLAAALQALMDGCTNADEDGSQVVQGSEDVNGGKGVSVEVYASEGGGMRV